MAGMTASRWDPQRTELAYAPPAYPSHDYKGTGTVWRVMTPNGELVGTLTYTGNPAEAVEWQSAPDLDDTGYEYASAVFIMLMTGAGEDEPLPDVLGKIFAFTKVRVIHDADLAVLKP